MGKLAIFARRAKIALRYGVLFKGMARTRLPRPLRIGRQRLTLPDDPALTPDFVNVVLDDDYGLRVLKDAPHTIVDIGANVGLFSCFARERFPDATIHAYEPSPAIAAIADRNTADQNTAVFQEGVSSTAGRANMVETGSSILAQTEASEDGVITLTPFSEVVERIGGHIDFLKVDCEGAEWDFMRGEEAFANVKRIRMEYHLTGTQTVGDLHALAAGIGFRVGHLVENQGFGIAWLSRRPPDLAPG